LEQRGRDDVRLFGFEKRWLLRIFDAIIPSGADERLPVGACDLPMDRFADEVMVYAPPRAAFGVRGAIWLVTFFGPLLVGKLGWFPLMRVKSRSDVLARLSHHRLYLVRELTTLFKVLVTLGYGGAPIVLKAVGVPVIDDEPPSWMA
jgi:hypothetical protein